MDAVPNDFTTQATASRNMESGKNELLLFSTAKKSVTTVRNATPLGILKPNFAPTAERT
jgi:hypothetical protein